MLIEFIQSDMFHLISAGTLTIMLTLLIIISLRLRKINKAYTTFMKKLGKGENIEEMLKTYIDKVETIGRQNDEIIKYCTRIDEEMTTCIQKVGLVRYNAFKDTGSDLSFAVALLDDNNDGVVLNGIYSREMSNIYAKQVTNGQAASNLSEEEKTAISMAINQIKA